MASQPVIFVAFCFQCLSKATVVHSHCDVLLHIEIYTKNFSLHFSLGYPFRQLVSLRATTTFKLYIFVLLDQYNVKYARSVYIELQNSCLGLY